MTTEQKIYSTTGAERLTAVPEKGSTRDFMLMQKDEIRLRFTLAEAVTLHAGDWTSIEGAGIFECMDDKQRPTWDSNTGGYSYDIIMQARYRKFDNRLHRFFTETSSPEAKWTLTAGIAAHAERIAQSMNALASEYATFQPGDSQSSWAVAVDGTVDKEKCIAITYDGTSILSAIDMIAREFECEWWFDGATLNFGVCRYGTAIAMETGKELSSLTRSDSSESDATRIYFQGSTRNIPSTYRHTALFHADEKSTSAGIFTFRDSLRDLPNDALLEETRTYGFWEDAKQDLDIKERIISGSAFEANEKGDAVEMEYFIGLIDDRKQTSGNSEIQFVTQWKNGGVDSGLYRIDMSGITMTLSNIHNINNTLEGATRFACRLTVEGYKTYGSHTAQNLLFSQTFIGAWKSVSSGNSLPVSINGGVHEFTLPEKASNSYFSDCNIAELCFKLGIVADTSDCAVSLICNVSTNIDNNTKTIEGCLTPHDPYHFHSAISVQFRNSKGDAIGNVVDGVIFNPEHADLKTGRVFRMASASLPDTSSLSVGEDLCFTFEKGVDIPFIPAAYWTSDTVMKYGSEATVNGLAERRLLLPLKDENGKPLYGYLDTKAGMTEGEVRETVKTIDDCYPGTETTITAIEQTETTYTDTYEMSDGSEDKVRWKAWQFKCGMFPDDSPFNTRYRLDSEKLQVTFRDYTDSAGVRHSGGALNGMTFELLYNQQTGMFEIVRDSTTLLPNDSIHPKVGDGMVLTGFDVRMLSDANCDIIAQAENDLLAKAREYIAEINTDASTYEGTVMCDIAYEQESDFGSMMLTPGHRVALTDPAFGLDSFVTRVLGYSIPLDIPYDNPKFTFGEKTAYSRLGNIEDRLNGIERPTHSKAGGSATGAEIDYDRDCYISLDTSLVQIPAVAKVPDDDESGEPVIVPADRSLPVTVNAWLVANGSRMRNAEWSIECNGCTATITPPTKMNRVGQIPAAKITISEVTTDMATVAITATSGDMTATDIITVDLVTEGHLHSMLISAPTVRISRKQDGTIISSPKKVKITTNIFEDGKLNPTEDGYLLYCTDIEDEAWNVMTRENGVAEITVADFLAENDTEDAKVRRIDFRYCCPTTEDIVGEGCVTFTEDSSITPVFDDTNGLLNFTTAEGTKLLDSGIRIVDRTPSMEIDLDGDPFLAYGETKTVRCKVLKGWEDVTDKVTAWTVTRDTGDPIEDTAWNQGEKAKAFAGALLISFTAEENDLGTNQNVLSTLFTFTAQADDGTTTEQYLTI